jgi:hypothetical protein
MTATGEQTPKDTSQFTINAAVPNRRELAITDAAHDALVQAQQALDAATAHRNSLLTGILASQDVRQGTVVDLSGPPWKLVVEIPATGNSP